MVLIVNKGKSMSVINKAEIKFPATETSRDILLERQFPSFKQDGIQLLLLPYIPHRNSNSVFGYNNRMLLIQGAYKRQKADRTGSGFGNGTAGHIRFIYGTGFRCCQQIVDSLIESGLHPLETPLLEQAAKTLKRAMFISRFLPPDRSNRTASP